MKLDLIIKNQSKLVEVINEQKVQISEIISIVKHHEEIHYEIDTKKKKE